MTNQEKLVEERVRQVLPDGSLVYANVRWIAPTRPGGPARDGEADLVLVDPNRGLLVIETKGGRVQRDRYGRWYANSRHLPESPFAQAEAGKHALAEKIHTHVRWTGDKRRAVHAVAFPEVDRASLERDGHGLGPDAPLELVLDRSDLATPDATRRALDRVFAYWSGDGARDRPLTPAQLDVVRDILSPEAALRPLLRGDIEEGERELLVPTRHQLHVLKVLRGERRASIVGCAGSGKTILAKEKARQLGSEGFATLLVCFNQPLARALARDPDLAPLVASGRLTVSTFHELCRRLAKEAGVLPPQPPAPPKEWFDSTLPRALEQAIPMVGGRWQAVVVDEGQDFAADWLQSLDLLTSDQGNDVFYLFHDPAQSLFREDATEVLSLREFELPDNCRNARPIHQLAYRFYSGELQPEPMRDDGREPDVIAAEPGEETVGAVREVLQRLVAEEHVERGQVAVLVGQSLERSAVWRQRRFAGGNVLWNGSVDEAGRSLGLAADAVPPQPPGTILCETIHRFKGLEREVIVLCELRPEDERLAKLLYIGISRAKHHLVVVAPAAVTDALHARERRDSASAR